MVFIILFLNFWWLVRVTLVVALWLFCPKILGGGGDLRIIILLKNKCSFSGGDTQPLQDGKKIFELCALRGGGDNNFLIISSSLELALVLELVLGVVGT